MSYLQHCKSTDNHTNFMANKKIIKPSPINIKNKRASFDFEFIDTFTAGIVLTGTEIKSIRLGKASLVDTFCYFNHGELWVKNMNISQYSSFNNICEDFHQYISPFIITFN